MRSTAGYREWLLLCCVLLMSISVDADSRPAADLIIVNAKVWTVDKAQPTAQAVAVLGERIVAVGSNEDVELWRGPGSKVVDAGGKLLLPGFNDAHVHFVSGGLQLDAVQLNDATTKEEFARRIGDQAKKTPKGEWIQGGDWDETKWSPPQYPTKEAIDSLTPNTPVFVSRYDGHMVLANSLALRLAEQKLTIQEAIEAYTMGSAYAEFQENEKGSITPGKLADMVLLDQDILTIPPERIRDVKVLKTFVGGRLVWDAAH